MTAAFGRLDPRPLRYDEYVTLVLHRERIRLERIVDLSEAVGIGMGERRIPDAWIEALTDDPHERTSWKLAEFRKEVRR